MILKTIDQVLRHEQCMGCGLCALKDNIEMVPKEGMIVPSSNPKDEIVEKSCPSKGYDMKAEGKSLFGDVNYRYEIGYYRRLRLANSNSEQILKNASSGGVMSQIALYLLEEKLVDGIISTRFVYDNNLVRAERFIAYSLEDILSGQGSKYCPTSTLSILNKLESGKKYLLIGTPCQIAGFRLYAKQVPAINDQIPYTIANFCGGYRDYRELDYFVQKVAHVEEVKFFRHRGGGQPGSMRIEGKNGEIFEYPYPKYARLSNVIKHERCTLCMDATGELADFSCGDAWLENRDKTAPWSIIVARSEKAEKVLDELEAGDLMTFKNDVTEDELVYSQKKNITSKKYRQFKRIKVLRFLNMPRPNWNDEFPVREGSMLKELKIIMSKTYTKLFR